MAIKVLTLEGLQYYHGKIKALLSGKVDVVEGKQLSTEDYTTAEKTKLAGIAEGAQVNVIETVKLNGSALAVTEKGVNIDLSSYALKADIASVYRVMGSVATYDALPTDPAVGDVYNIEADGSNYVWTGTAWDALGGTVDLSGFYTKTEVDSALALKADKTALESAVNTINGELALKAVKTEVDSALALKADASALESAVSTINAEVALKANASDVYTKTEVDTMVSTINGDIDAVEAKFADYVLSSDIVEISNAEIDSAMA